MQLNIRKIRRQTVTTLLILAAAVSIFIAWVSFNGKQWEALASSMAVITAILAIWSSLNVTWQQEDGRQAQLALYIDNFSHKYAYSLVIINKGGTPAYNVVLQWEIPLLDYEQKPPRFTDFDDEADFGYLPPEISYSRFIMGTDHFQNLVKESKLPLYYEGTISYSLSSKSKFRINQNFKLSLEPFKKHINVLNDQSDFYFQNKKATEHLKEIAKSLENISEAFEKNSQQHGM